VSAVSDGEILVEAACAIRPYLPALLAEEAVGFEAELAALLAEEGEPAGLEDKIVALLDSRVATREWAAGFLEHGLPPDLVQLAERGFGELPGYGEPVRADKYRCPFADYVWYRHAVGEAPPECPTHGVPLEAVVRTG
jgi:hypothetical protein